METENVEVQEVYRVYVGVVQTVSSETMYMLNLG